MSDEEPPPPKRRWTNRQVTLPSGERQLVQKVKKKKLKESSKNWVQRQLNDPYVARAQAEGMRARAAYKLIELDEKFHFLKRGMRIIDLGAAPGGWAQVAVQRGCKVVGIDLLPIDPLPGATFIEMDFLDEKAPARLINLLGGPPDLVLSDMAANTTGHQQTDQIRTGALAEAAAEFAIEHVAPGGAFVTKAFQGGLEAGLLARLKQSFATVRHAKPPASRAESSEVYVVAQGRKG
ncbi:RlmE family RNA methyltransferase [Terricaulis sp.]|uniref:RlmE family RNA methyltransferase n=1 Tax=Terricaulis sp. TaxID=2768686 RepID=UPI003782DF95